MKRSQVPDPSNPSAQPAPPENPNPTAQILQKNRLRIGKMLLLAALGLSALVLLELRQEMVEAIDLSDRSQPLNLPAQPQSLPQSLPQPTAPAAQPQATLQPTAPATAPRQTLAINSATHPAQADQQVAQVSPPQIATSIWATASFPVENFQTYTSPFGYRRSPSGASSREFHYGLDMAAPEGSYIRNWWTGTVVEVSDNSNCGTSVVVESGHWLHIYCHMQGHVESDDSGRYMIDREGGIQIWEGQQVAAGTRIGRVGMTGRTTGPHLHWGLKYDSNWVDPALVLRAMYAGQRAASRPAGAQ